MEIDKLPRDEQKDSLIIKTDANDATNCKVVVRVKPAADCASIWSVDYNPSLGGGIQINDEYAAQCKKRQDLYSFDGTFEDSDNKKLYDAVAKESITAFMNGTNAIVFAYGQTSSGKTYSMMGNEANPGIITQAVSQIFNFIKASKGVEYLLRVSYLEIYNEILKDLLNPHQKDLRIHENTKRGVFVTPLKEEIVSSPTQVMQLIRDGELNRHVSSTSDNQESSRSHTIVHLVLEISVGDNVTVSDLHLIDLAGSEKASANMQRQKEGSFINRSLLTLSTVISRLTAEECEGEQQHIPFRDSKLTRLLQLSLIGKSKIGVIATLNPNAKNVEESLNTLKFASRVKKIVSRPEVFKLSEKTLLQKYKNEIKTLKHQLDEFNQALLAKSLIKLQDDEKTSYEEKLEDSRLESLRLKERINHLTKIILTSKSVVNINTSEETLTTAESAILPPSSKLSKSMPSLFDSQQPMKSLDGETLENDLKARKLQILVSFIKTLKRSAVLNRREELQTNIENFQLDSFIERKLSIPDLKLEAALKRVNDLKDEKSQLEVVLIDSAFQISILNQEITELKEMIAFNEKDHQELSALAKDQQEIIESLQQQIQNTRTEFLEYRDLVGKRKGAPNVSSQAIKSIEKLTTSDKSGLSDVSRHELLNLVAYLKVTARSF